MAMVPFGVDDMIEDCALWAAVDEAEAAGSAYKRQRLDHHGSMPMRERQMQGMKQPAGQLVITELPPSPRNCSGLSSNRDGTQMPSMNFNNINGFSHSKSLSGWHLQQSGHSIISRDSSLSNSHSVQGTNQGLRRPPPSQFQERALMPLQEISQNTNFERANRQLVSPNEPYQHRQPGGAGPMQVLEQMGAECMGKDMLAAASAPTSWVAGMTTAETFKHFQRSALEILERDDWTMLQGKPYIKKSGWRKIAFYFGISFEIKDRKMQLDQNSDVVRSEFLVKAIMQTGRFAEAYGSCDRKEKKFGKPNNDIPAIAETRAKNRACQDLLGIGEFKQS